ncbi:GrpB family protein [Allorhizocola rhizosphaerae]|uniref:GrpB family protein n=1 Tax=Allorhizocola rhizosphaerae TaxID=1872709 RepID=UPI001B8B4921|nr:GrpB family protein [Allorhizocola rhizosphaerae]
MPFPDESLTVAVRPYDPSWPADFALISAELSAALGDIARAVDHVGSTSIPGMPAKDCIDVQVRVGRMDREAIMPALSAIGFRLRDEPWNTEETSFDVTSPKLVFAPPVGARRANVHVRAFGSPNARFALLFRDYLRNSPVAREAWGAFKVRLAQDVTDLYSFGQIKQPAMVVLMEAACGWAAESGWTTPE